MPNKFPFTWSSVSKAALAFIFLFHASVFAQENIANGKVLFAQKCAVCHGKYGEVSNEVIPNILGQYPEYMLGQMHAFLSDDPKSARAGVAGRMKRSLLSDLSAQDIADVRAYISTVKYRCRPGRA